MLFHLDLPVKHVDVKISRAKAWAISRKDVVNRNGSEVSHDCNQPDELFERDEQIHRRACE